MTYSIESDLKGKDNYLNDLSLEIKDLKDEVNNKEKKGTPDVINVRNRTCAICDKVWVYEGSWLSWGKNSFDNPWGWKWHFISNDGKYILDGKWDDNWVFKFGKLTSYWRNFNILNVKSWANGKILKMIWTGSIGWVNYTCEFNENLELSRINYGWIVLNLEHEHWKTYLKNKAWKRLELAVTNGRKEITDEQEKFYEDIYALAIAKYISAVKKNWKKIDYFYDNGVSVAMKFKDWSYAHLSEVGLVDTDYVVDWLNESRKDFGI